ncbi:PQQ-binding-like beta-propeller repeat protein [Streptomyces sp. NPDC019937]|uniref:outer membrane protein assembly factor BamB family protein n=1 Tax=Streptomyces sp. NPDC019937 TaxID=3154787 RepID=UPI0033C988FC
MNVQAAEPARLGPYRLVGMVDAHGRIGGARRRFARDDRTGRMAVLMFPDETLAEDPGYRVRFRAEAENSRRLTGSWAAPVIDIAPAHEDLPWVAYDCFPALSLAGALAAYKGPLPESTVRALGTVLAQALADWHAGGLVHAGISPATTLLMTDGPRLTGYGLVRAAALDGSGHAGSPGIDLFSLPPEQRTGGRPRPAGDIYALGAVLCYAATGRADLSYASRAALPERMGGLIAACLAADPEARPRPVTVARKLREAGTADTSGGLPRPIVATLGELDATYPAEPAGYDAEHVAEPGTAARPGPSRRAVTIGVLSGAVGLGLGAGGVAGWRAAGEEPGLRTEPNLRGTAPAPLWRHDVESELRQDPLLWQGRVALVNTARSVTALTLRTGRALWSRDDLYPMSSLLLLGDGTFLSPDTSAFSAVSLSTGRIMWVERRYSGVDAPSVFAFLAAGNNTLWFLIKGNSEEGAKRDEYAVVAYDLRKRKERWRTPLPEAFHGDGSDTISLLLESMILLPSSGAGTGDGPVSYLALDRRNGRKLWIRTYRGTDASNESPLVAPGNLLITCGGEVMKAHDIVSGKERWRARTRGTPSAAPVTHGHSVYVTDSHATTHAVDIRSGRARWRRRSAVPLNFSWAPGETAVSHAGTTVFQSTQSEIEAFDATDGALRWRFAPAGSGGQSTLPGRVTGTAPGMAFVLSDSVLYALPVD